VVHAAVVTEADAAAEIVAAAVTATADSRKSKTDFRSQNGFGSFFGALF